MKFMQSVLVGLGFAMGLAFIVDGGRWQQPLGVLLVMASVAEITWLLYALCERHGMYWSKPREQSPHR